MQNPFLTTKEDCLTKLRELAIPFKQHDHEAVFTMDMIDKLHLQNSPYIKNLLFSEKKNHAHYIILTQTSTKPGKNFWKKMGTSHNNVRMAKEDILQELLKSKKGALNPFCLANDFNHVVKLIIDEALFRFDTWSFHPMDNSTTIELRRDDFFKFTAHFKIEYTKVSLQDAQQSIKPVINEPKIKEVEKQTKQAKQAIQDNSADTFEVNPYVVSNTTNKEMDYSRLIVKFGCYNIDQTLINRIEKLTKKPIHRFITRNIFFAHRDFDLILNAYQKHQDKQTPPFYLYTGRGPSSEALHLGHMLPFIFNKYLQQTFNVPFVIQISDDEKYFHKEGENLKDFTDLAMENIKDIIALGFDPEKTFIFINSQYMGHLYPNVCKFQRYINLNTLKAIFGLQFGDNCGKASYPAVQAAPCLSSSFPHMFGNKNIPCLIPCGIDQDPYFRMARDVCTKIKAPKPAGMYAKFFPALQGFHSKMSGSDPASGIFMTDTPKQIEEKITRYAFSGGRATKQEQQKYGADLEIDIPYNYLKFFMENDEELAEIGEKYRTGKMLTGEIKKILIKELQAFVGKHQEMKSKLTEKDVQRFLSNHERKYENTHQ